MLSLWSCCQSGREVLSCGDVCWSQWLSTTEVLVVMKENATALWDCFNETNSAKIQGWWALSSLKLQDRWCHSIMIGLGGNRHIGKKLDQSVSNCDNMINEGNSYAAWSFVALNWTLHKISHINLEMYHFDQMVTKDSLCHCLIFSNALASAPWSQV